MDTSAPYCQATTVAQEPVPPLRCERRSFEHRRIEVNGVGLNVIVDGQGPAVLLVHGFPDSHQVWRHQIPTLVAAGYQVIAPDLRGYGNSDMLPEVADYRVANFVADLVGVLDALGVSQVQVVGHDWGAVIGWALTLAQPQRVTHYVALSVGHPNAYPRGGLAQKLKGWYVLLMQWRGGAEWLMQWGDWWFFRLFTHYPGEFAIWREDLSRPGRLRAAINIYRANLAVVLPQREPAATVPVLGVWSSRDRFLSERQMQLSAQYVNAPWRYVRLDGVNHWISLDAPDRLNALLLDSLRHPRAHERTAS